ncbi:general odorant-binding protein 19d-like isoform X2 [Periplaneta americana]|uniref:general odorant-binding protein 19d-like isoform X2 n=1 Tax=Periplaneta americana TaxID=6978 RepID=UPI0037E901ED
MRFSVYCLILLSVPAFVLAGENNTPTILTNTIKNIVACKQEHNATRDDYDNIRKSQIPKTGEGKCFMACIFEKFRVVEGGKYSTDSFMKGVTELYKDEPQKITKATEMVQQCGKRSKEWNNSRDKCVYAVKVMECLASYVSRVPVVKDFLKYQKVKQA